MSEKTDYKENTDNDFDDAICLGITSRAISFFESFTIAEIDESDTEHEANEKWADLFIS